MEERLNCKEYVMNHCCEYMDENINKSDIGIKFFAKFREYGISYLDGGTAIQEIKYCPWCGYELPNSLREQWFEKLEELGLEPDSPNIPEDYLTEAWYCKQPTSTSP